MAPQQPLFSGAQVRKRIDTHAPILRRQRSKLSRVKLVRPAKKRDFCPVAREYQQFFFPKRKAPVYCYAGRRPASLRLTRRRRRNVEQSSHRPIAVTRHRSTSSPRYDAHLLLFAACRIVYGEVGGRPRWQAL